MRYRPERGDLLIEADVGWNPGVAGNVSLAADYLVGRFRPALPSASKTLRAWEFRIPDVLRGAFSMRFPLPKL